MTRYGVTKDYDYSATHKRERLEVWSGPFYSVWEGTAYSLPHGNGYMITTYNGDKVRVTCPTNRDDDNYEQIDSAIRDAMNAYETARGSVQFVTGD